jgi:hypothetical protein
MCKKIKHTHMQQNSSLLFITLEIKAKILHFIMYMYMSRDFHNILIYFCGNCCMNHKLIKRRNLNGNFGFTQ